MSIWMYGKKLMNRNCLKNMNFRANKQNIRDTDYMYANRVFKDFETKNFGYYHDLQLASDALLLVDAFKNF